MDKVLKRDGEIVEFNSTKIADAIKKASETTKEFDAKTAQKLTRNVIKIVKDFVREKEANLKAPTIEEIQDIVEKVLLSSDYKQTAKSYILYREQHSKIRDFVANASVDMIDEYLKQLDWRVNENSNMSYSIQGLNNYLASNISKTYWLNKIYSNEIKEAHQNGDIHIHDLNIISAYCVGWDLKDLLTEGFKGVEGKVESAPPKHLRTALGQMVNFLYTMQGE
ncbi:MAG: anaerobic ribonucleoside-triphosphate reductase, partial [Oscillospiraceae bacterium]